MDRTGWSFGIMVMLAGGAARAESLPVAEVEATSTLRGANDAYAAFRAVDDNARTGWCEGRADAGSGERLRIKLAGKVFVQQLRFFAGYHKSKALKAANNMPRKLTVTIDNQAPRDVEVDDTGIAIVKVGSDVLEVAVAFGESRPGKMNDTCISEIEVWKSDMTKLIPPPVPKKAKAPKGKLACKATLGDGTVVELPQKSKPRLEQPVTCVLSIAAPQPETYRGVIQTAYALGAGKQRVNKDGAPRAGQVETTPADKATLTETLQAEGDVPDFETCVRFDILARLEDGFGRAAWNSKLAVQQYCPD